MKKILVITALFAVNVAGAQTALTPGKVSAECVRQMSLGICMVRPDRSKLTPGETMHIAGVRDVPMAAVADYMDLYDETSPTNPAMCDLALQYMTTEPGSDHDVIARALWTPNDMEGMEQFLRQTSYEEQVKRWTLGAVGVAFLGLVALGARVGRQRRAAVGMVSV